MAQSMWDQWEKRVDECLYCGISVDIKTAVTHKRISQKRAGHVDKNVKFNIHQEHVGDTLETGYVCVGYAWCTSGARR